MAWMALWTSREQCILHAFSKTFDTVSHSTLTDKSVRYGLEKCPIRWVENWLDSQAQSVVICDMKSDWWLITSDVPQGLILGVNAASCLY